MQFNQSPMCKTISTFLFSKICFSQFTETFNDTITSVKFNPKNVLFTNIHSPNVISNIFKSFNSKRSHPTVHHRRQALSHCRHDRSCLSLLPLHFPLLCSFGICRMGLFRVSCRSLLAPHQPSAPTISPVSVLIKCVFNDLAHCHFVRRCMCSRFRYARSSASGLATTLHVLRRKIFVSYDKWQYLVMSFLPKKLRKLCKCVYRCQESHIFISMTKCQCVSCKWYSSNCWSITLFWGGSVWCVGEVHSDEIDIVFKCRWRWAVIWRSIVR